MLRITWERSLKVIYSWSEQRYYFSSRTWAGLHLSTLGVIYNLDTVKLTTLKTIRAKCFKTQSRFSTYCQLPRIRHIVVLRLKYFFGAFLLKMLSSCSVSAMCQERVIIIIIIIYSIYRVLIPNGPKALYILKSNDKILNLQNYIVIL